ncbi:MAG: hypothetical protein ABII00_06770, partial [Elusimicrobiota bacterium]
DVAFNAQKLTGVADPALAQDGATKNYVDTQIAAVSPAEKCVDRGDPAEHDFTEADLTIDSGWHDLSLAAIVPAEAANKFVLLRVEVTCSAAGAQFYFRKNGNANERVSTGVRTPVANQQMSSMCGVFCDADRVIEYLGNPAVGAFTLIRITVVGWTVDAT